MKKVLGILLVALALLAFTGCGIVAPDCEIDDYYLYNNNSTLTPSSGTYSIDLGDAFSIYVAANTVLDGVYGSTIDYEGTLEVSCPSSAFSAYSSSYPLSLTFQGYTGLDYYADSGEATDGEERFYVVFDTVGTYTVTITLTNSDGVTDTETIDIDVTGTPVTSVSLNNSTLSVAVGATATLAETVYPSGATNSSVTWSSSNTSVATVSSTGTVTGVAAGTATITVTTDDGSKTDTCTVTVAAVSALPWDGETVTDLSYQDFDRGNLSSAADVDWYRKATGSSTYYLHWLDDASNNTSSLAELTISVYGDDGTEIQMDDLSSPTASISTAGYSYIYFKVESYASDYGDYFLQVNNSSTIHASTLDADGGNDGSLSSAGEIDAWIFDPTSTGTYKIQFEDSSTGSTLSGSSYTCDVEISAWENSTCLTHDLDYYSSSNADLQEYVSSYSEIIILVYGYASSGDSTRTGTYYVDID